MNSALSAVQTSKQPGGSDDGWDRTITCQYGFGSGGTADFSQTGMARAYLDEYGADDTWNKSIMPYFCAFPADNPPPWSGYDLQSNPDGTQQTGARKIASRFVGLGSEGDAEFCRNWVNRNPNDSNIEGMAMTVMSSWCNARPWLPECKCLKRGDALPPAGYGDAIFKELYVGMAGYNDHDGCWWEPCSQASWNNGNMLVEPDNIFPGDCGDACSNIVIVIGSENIDLDDINQDMACTINESDIPYSDNDEPDCGTQADPKQCVCDNVHFSTADSFIQDSITDNGMTTVNNQNLIATKANQYAKDKCYSGQTFDATLLDNWLSTPPILDKIPVFNATTGAFEGAYETGIPTAAQKQAAHDTWMRMDSDTQYPCAQTYPVNMDVAGTIQGAILNEHYAQCCTNERLKFATPDPITNACPYTFIQNDVYGVTQTYTVDPTYRSLCVDARGGVDYLDVDGEDPAIDDVDKEYGLCTPVDGQCPEERTYTDNDGVSHTKTMNPDELEVCRSDPSYTGEDDDTGNGGDDSVPWFDKQSSGVQIAIIAGSALIGGIAAIVGGVMLYKGYKAQK
ncbi:MAG: hypothetical protein PHN45_00160 [Methylococcales bacterium]|nr:hypothetical protein [Methylococcales bacterium]